MFFKLPSFIIGRTLKLDKVTELNYYPVSKAPPVADLAAHENKMGRSSVPAEKPSLPVKRSISLSKPAMPLKGDPEKPVFEPVEVDKADFIEYIPSGEKMLISHQGKDLSSDPTYLTYYNVIRSKIHRTANATKPYHFREGAVKLKFTITSDGGLKRCEILPNSTAQNRMLRRHALYSIKRAAPFPPFLNAMNENELTLILVISFERQ